MARFTVTMPDDLRDTVKKLGDAETRNLSDQVTAMVLEALRARKTPIIPAGTLWDQINRKEM